MSGVLRWESPLPAADQKALQWAPIALELRQRPNEWAVISEGDFTEVNRAAQYARGGRGPFQPKGAFEVTTRTIRKGREVGKVVAYARYVGGEQS